MFRLHLLVAIIFLQLGSIAVAQEKTKPRLLDENEPDISKFMRAKLQHSQKLIESLVTEDYDAMAKSSQEMSLLTLAASWQVLQTPEYLHESMAFRKSADTLTAAAKKKNLDGAALAYLDMTMQCVKCHKMVRHSKMAALDPADKTLLLLKNRRPDLLPSGLATKAAVVATIKPIR